MDWKYGKTFLYCLRSLLHMQVKEWLDLKFDPHNCILDLIMPYCWYRRSPILDSPCNDRLTWLGAPFADRAPSCRDHVQCAAKTKNLHTSQGKYGTTRTDSSISCGTLSPHSCGAPLWGTDAFSQSWGCPMVGRSQQMQSPSHCLEYLPPPIPHTHLWLEDHSCYDLPTLGLHCAPQPLENLWPRSPRFRIAYIC